ncbi:MAG: hypothetical protein AB1449_07815 [Chloroflexota bacterium]
MSTYTARSRSGLLFSAGTVVAVMRRLVSRLSLSRGLAFGLIILGGMIGFEVFNYSTTEFGLADLLGEPRFAGVRWATILALAFCAIDFAGIARLLTPERGRQDAGEVWYLLGAWFLAATMNAVLTWWGVSLALLSHDGLGNEILGRATLLSTVPLFVAVLVWLIRVLMIGTLTLAGPRLFSQESRPASARMPRLEQRPRVSASATNASAAHAMARPVRPAPKSNGRDQVLGTEALSARPSSHP